MKLLKGRREIAEAINFGKYPVLKIDLADSDEYGLNGSVCKIDMGNFRDGSKWYERSCIRVYSDKKQIQFCSFACILSSSYGYSDLMEDVETAMSPIIMPDSEFVLVVFDSTQREAYAVYIVQTGKASPLCQTPIDVEPVDMSAYLNIANERYGKYY